MARVKSGFRKRFNIRYWRWWVAKVSVGKVAWLRRRFSFYPAVLTPTEAAGEVLEDRRENLPTLFTPQETAFVTERCWPYDTLARDWAGGASVPVHRLAVTIQAAELLGHVSRIALPARHGIVMHDVTFANWNFAKAKRLRELPAIASRSHLLARTDNYYHLLFHDLVPLVDYLDRLHPKGMPLTLVLPPSRLASLALGCKLLAQAYPGIDLVDLPADAKRFSQEALWLSFDAGNAEWTFGDAAPVHRLAELFRAHYGVEAGGGRRLFFSRGASKIRRLRNEEALWRLAQAHGFERFEATGSNHGEQVRAFSQADIVIGVHGAGLGNLLFCRPGTRLIEIFPENFTKSTYLWLSKRIGLDYRWLIGSEGDYDQAFTLDEALFEATLNEVLAASPAGQG